MNPTVQTINVHELKNRMDNDPVLCLIDVRELSEWQEVHIPGAVHLPKNELALNIETLIKNKVQPVYLHCRSGVRSLDSAQNLLDLGYAEVYSVEGGIIEWAMFGYPIAQ